MKGGVDNDIKVFATPWRSSGNQGFTGFKQEEKRKRQRERCQLVFVVKEGFDHQDEMRQRDVRKKPSKGFFPFTNPISDI